MRVRVFYGWYIVAASVVISAFLGGVTSYGFTALVNPIVSTLGWSYAQVSLAMSLRGVENGVLGPFVGKAIDLWPAKWLVLTGVILIGLGFVCLSRVTSLALYYISFAIIALGSTLGTHMTATATLVRWFKRNVGKAIGMLALGIGLGGVFTPVLVKLIDAFSWRTALIIMAVTMWVSGIPLSFVFRSRPEDYGLFPDGKPPDGLESSVESETYDFGTGVREALKQRAFWQMGLANTLQMLGVSAIALHVMPFLASVGIDRATASMVAMLFTLVSLPARIAFGWICDIFKKTYVQTVAMLLTSAGLFVFSLTDRDSLWLAFLFTVIYGIGVGGANPTRALVVREYFGTRNFGSIFGITTLFMTVGSVIGPPLAGWVFDTRGIYDPIWAVFSSASLIAAILMLTMPLSPKPSRRLPAT